MDLSTYESLIRSESAARRFVLGFCFKNQQRLCPRCRTRKLYRTGDRRRCARCRYTFHDLTDRWINRGRLTPGQWLRIVKHIAGAHGGRVTVESTPGKGSVFTIHLPAT